MCVCVFNTENVLKFHFLCFRSKYNLNALSHDTAINLIRKAIESGVQLKEVYLDTVGPADKYQIKLRALFPNIKVVVSNKADSIYKIVSVASICAKVTRDHAVKNWQFLEEGISFSESEYGSGYPGGKGRRLSKPTKKFHL